MQFEYYDKIKGFYFETSYDITFYSTTEDVKLVMPKTEDNYVKLQKIINSNQYEFIKLIQLKEKVSPLLQL
mgnify:CR=1 FL=1